MVSAFGVMIYALAFLGSFSLGYLLLRTAFPEKQKLLTSQKLEYGYAIGAPIIVLSAAFGEQYFFFIFAFLSTMVFAIALGKRLTLKEEDFVKLEVVEEVKSIPERALTKEEKLALAEGRELPGRKERAAAAAKPKAKRITAEDIRPVNVKAKEQVFKEDKPNILQQVQKETSDIEKKDRQTEKEQILKRLKHLANEVKKTKKAGKKAKEEDEDFRIEDLDLE